MIIEVENFLPDELVDQLVEFSQQPDVNWELAEMQNHLPRKKISWLLDSPIETAHNYFESLPLFKHFNFIGLSLWKDDVNFYMSEHVDNDRVKVAIQIYLDNRNSPGTQFGNRIVKYGRNRGYIMHNGPTMFHSVPKQIPHDGRLSIYALYQ